MFLISPILSFPCVVPIPFSQVSHAVPRNRFEAFIILIFFSFLWVLTPVILHLVAFIYSVITQDRHRVRIQRVQGGWTRQEKNYVIALVTSAFLSYVVTRYSVCTPTGTSHPVWYVDVSIVVAALLIPTFHAYFLYDGDVREVVLLVMIYAPWVHFIRLFVAYMLRGSI